MTRTKFSTKAHVIDSLKYHPSFAEMRVLCNSVLNSVLLKLSRGSKLSKEGFKVKTPTRLVSIVKAQIIVTNNFQAI